MDLKLRTRDFALRVIRLYASLPKSAEALVIGKHQRDRARQTKPRDWKRREVSSCAQSWRR